MNRTEKKTDILIIGGGLTGLTLAHNLKKRGVDFTLLEKENRTGGVIGTRRENGFVYETGPTTGVLSSPELVQLFDELEGKCEVEKADETSKYRLIWKGGKWHALPSGLVSAVTTPLFTLKDKFRILGEPFRKPGTDPYESVASLVRRRMGESFLDYAIDPFIGGIYAGDPSTLVTRFALPKLYNLEQNYGSFIKGAVKKGKEPKSELEKRATKDVFSVAGGLGNLIAALEQSAGSENILTSCTDTEVMPAEHGFVVTTSRGGAQERFNAAMVVITTGAGSFSSLMPFADPGAVSSITSLRYAKVVQASVGYNNWKGRSIKAFGGLFPSKEYDKLLGILFPSSIFSGRAPEGGALLSVFSGGSRNPGVISLDDSEIKELVMKAVREVLSAGNDEPDLFRIFRYEHAIPQYEKSSEERFEAIKNLENKYQGLIIAGNSRNGIGISDRVVQASKIAAQVENFLR
jgi:oxygen-dependent protoporphyrinogen oxidase